MNKEIFLFLYGLSKYPLVGSTALFFSYILPYILLIALFVWAVFYSDRKMFNFSLLFLVSIASYFCAHSLKSIFHMIRPFKELGIKPLYLETGFSFPSEHATVFAAITFACFFVDKRLGISVGVLAVLIGLSRIIIGVHYLIDIIGGFILGYIVSLLFIKIFRKI